MKSILSLSLLFVCAASAVAQTKAGAPFRAGAVAMDITPLHLPVSMTGSFQDRKATSAHDPLHARCIVLESGETRVAIVVCDVALISRDIFDAAKKMASKSTGILEDHILMSSTHTHTAPTIVPLGQCLPDLNYVKYMTQQIAEAIVQANKRLAPARIGWGVAEDPSEVGNRRWFIKPEAITETPIGGKNDKVRTNPPRDNDLLIKPAGPVDPVISILSIQDGKGKPLALLGNYSLHYVGGIPPNQLSADYFGEFARRIGERLKAPESFVGILSNGSSGDINNYHFRSPRPRAEPFERIRAVADKIAAAAQTVDSSIQHSVNPAFAMLERKIDLGVRRPDVDLLKRSKDILAKAKDSSRLNSAELYAQEQIRLYDFPATMNLKLQVLRIGDLGIVAVPCEVFAEIGLEIRKKSPFKHTFVIGLANGYNGYLPTPEQHRLGGYETWPCSWSYLETEASTKIVRETLEMLGKLKKL